MAMLEGEISFCLCNLSRLSAMRAIFCCSAHSIKLCSFSSKKIVTIQLIKESRCNRQTDICSTKKNM